MGVFLFKQKTAYELRISDGSSDVCSSDLTGEAGKMFADMVTDWSNGDDQGIAALMNDGLGDSPELERVMLTDRNARWAGWIAARMKQPGTVFVAVGAGHLAGENSVRPGRAYPHPTGRELGRERTGKYGTL